MMSSAFLDHARDRARKGGIRQFLGPFSYLSSSSLCRVGAGVDERCHGCIESTVFTSIRGFHATAPLGVIEKDYYAILGVSKDANKDDIKKAFHALAKKYHPDANKNNPAAKRKFQEIRDAYEILSDSEKRAQYDREFSKGTEKVRYSADDTSGFRRTYRDPFSDFRTSNQDPFSDTFYKIFSEVFEDDRDIYADDAEVVVNLSFSEAAKGCIKQVAFGAKVLCDSCYGRGHPVSAKPSICPTCNGVGRVTVFPFTTTCGLLPKVQGSGVVDGVKNVNVSIPAGVDSGDTIRVPEAGNSGRHGVHPGSLYIKLQVSKDPVFVRDGADIHVETCISFTQAILGGKVEVPTLTGKTQVKIPKGVQPGQVIVLRVEVFLIMVMLAGLPKQVGLVDHGDQHVRFRVHFPSSVSERQRELLEEFAMEEAMQENIRFAEGSWWQQLIGNLTGPKFMLGIALILLLNLLLSKSACLEAVAALSGYPKQSSG
uniref:J domain-containing protein n=1 Tax=Ananas comosus var. bracteatus TaxID=296719 RepID=A0A6V7P806_ANACO|nr:unnamed protein product [Ananas comosus var. bracteatus]